MKLKKLILSGFKSFADKTEFEFDDGITCIVGPNGCGKSNVVDAVKWVLGEQSAKSLRGSEMTDVLFNGSASRRAAGSAEATLVFDNSSGLLQTEIGSDRVAEGVVSVTRRLFRSGQSEYFINKTPCRLRDIREMFLDTGIGVNAYSLIEQGQVEAFLKASHDERRAIFDEAAGISKYKTRKKEALRKLERVEQNLLRLNDIVGEVEKQLRSIKYQAGKARSYQAYSQRLHELRGLYFLANYHELSARRNELQQQLDAHNDQLAWTRARIDRLEAARSGCEVEMVDLDRAARTTQGEMAETSSRIVSAQERAEMLDARLKEIGEQLVAATSRCQEQEAKLAAAEKELQDRAEKLNVLEAQAQQHSQSEQAARQEYLAAGSALAELEAELEDEKAGVLDLLRRTAQLHNDIQSSRLRRENLNTQKDRLSGRVDEITQALEEALSRRTQVQAKLRDIAEVTAESRAKLQEVQDTSRCLLARQQALHEELASLREQRGGVLSRIEALREMLRQLDGVSAGAKRILKARQEGRLDVILGMVGDFLETDSAHAPVLEAALAGADQKLLAMRWEDVAAVQEEISALLGETGAVDVLCMNRLGPMGGDFDAGACEGAVGWVIDWVRFEPWLAPLVWKLLGRTLVVRTLDDALAASTRLPGGLRFVTLEGQVVEPDGQIRLGSANRTAGMISRRSELAELNDRLVELDGRLGEVREEQSAAESKLEHLNGLIHSLRTAVYEANTERVEYEGRLTRLEEQIQRLEREKPVVADDLRTLSEDISAAASQEQEARKKAAELDEINAQKQRHVQELTARLSAGRQRQAELAERMTELQVAVARAREQLTALREGSESLKRQRDALAEDLEAGRARIEADRRRRKETAEALAKTRSEIDELYLRQERLNRQDEEIAESRRGLEEKLEAIHRKLAEHKRQQEEITSKTNALRVQIGEVDVRIENLITRATEEMNIDLLEAYRTYQHDADRDWPAVEAEINDLREKIRRLGNVNLDAIAEQESLEQRREFLAEQLEDITTSRDRLDELIRRINRESRQMFVETFESVRKNFQQLFRKLFGGGRADIMLLNPEDVLESGIEIVARPPGKDLRSLSLLSGGEKTMTALALMFSIFKTRPSPFCLLDEVDAALDEANTERFIRLVREFVGVSQFIVISHAKRTIHMADALYGVTMAQPGVSKRISVRFEDAESKLGEPLEAVGA